MKDLISILRRFIPPYKSRVAKSVLFNFLHAIFGSLSIAMLIPILRIIFEQSARRNRTRSLRPGTKSIAQIFNYYVTEIKNSFGQANTLVFVGILAIISTAFKTGFAYLASYELIYIRNGVVRDIRRKIYLKILSLPLPFFSEERKGDIISRMTGDVQEVEASVMSRLDMLFQSPILIIVYLTTMLIMSWQLTFIRICPTPSDGVTDRQGRQKFEAAFLGRTD